MKLALDNVTLQIDDDYMVGCENPIGNAARFDGNEVTVGADAADVAEGQRDEAVFDQGAVRLTNFLFQTLEHRSLLSLEL